MLNTNGDGIKVAQSATSMMDFCGCHDAIPELRADCAGRLCLVNSLDVSIRLSEDDCRFPYVASYCSTVQNERGILDATAG